MKKWLFLAVVVLFFILMFNITELKIQFNDKKHEFYSKNSFSDFLKIEDLILKKTYFDFYSDDLKLNFKKRTKDFIALGYDIDNILKNNNFFLIKFKSIFGIYSVLRPHYIYSRELMHKSINAMIIGFIKEPVKMEIQEIKGFTKLKEDIPGITVNESEFEENVMNSIENRTFSVRIPVKIISHDINLKKYKETNGFKIKLSNFTTEFDESNKNRVHNLKVAAEALDLLILKSGQKISFNDFVGERTYAKGYKDAGVVYNGKIINGIAGGICQITSTLYNAILKAGIEIVKRYPHSIYDPSWAYTDRGFDSAVAYPYKDLIFRNSLDQDIMIDFEFDFNKVSCIVYGRKPLDFKIELVSGKSKIYPFSIKKEYSDKLNKGEKKVISPGVNGCYIETGRIFHYDDGRKKEESLGRDTYRKFDRLEKIGIN